MFISRTTDLHAAIERIVDDSPSDFPVCIAVAFWGLGAETLLPANRQFRIVCNLDSGGTNPDVIRRLLTRSGIEVRTASDLHAKVVLGQTSCLVGSANFSANALGLGQTGVWQEAGVLIEAPDTRLTEARSWFWELWSKSGQVTETLLRRAEHQWAARQALVETFAERSAEPDPYPLQESDLFKPVITGGNMIRMAAPWLELAFSKIEPDRNKSNIRIPAFVAALIWTHSGREMGTAIPGIPVFATTSHVWHRAMGNRQPKSNERQIHQLMRFVSEYEAAPSAVRFWARKYIEDGSPGAP